MPADQMKPAEPANPAFPNISVDTVDGKCVIVIDMYPEMDQPYQIESLGDEAKKYIKVSGASRFADSAVRKDLERWGVNRPFDEIVCEEEAYDTEKADKLCMDIKRYLSKSAKTLYEKENMEDVTEQNLVLWGILKDNKGTLAPTNAFLLLTENKFPFAKIQCALFKGTERVVFIDKREFDGPLYEQIEEAYAFVLKHINLGANINGLVRTDAYELPPEAIREAIVNAVTHRDFLDRACIQVAVYDDRVEVTSPGMLYGGLTIEQMKRGGSKIRNRCIAEVFGRMRIIEGWGTGVKRMISSCREYKIREPEFLEIGDSFRVNLYRPTYEQHAYQRMSGMDLKRKHAPVGYATRMFSDIPEETDHAHQKVFEMIMERSGITQYAMSKEWHDKRLGMERYPEVNGEALKRVRENQNIDLYL